MNDLRRPPPSPKEEALWRKRFAVFALLRLSGLALLLLGIAVGLTGLVREVKTGSGAFLKRDADARHLAELMVATGEASGTRTVALLTAMDEPLGRFAGNWIEVWECVEILQGKVHPLSADLVELSAILAGWMIFLGDKARTPDEGRLLAQEVLRSGAAYERWVEMVRLHGGDVSVFDDPRAHHRPGATRVLRAERDGYLTGMDCTEVGWAVQRLGAGREVPGAPVSASAGIEMHVKIGEAVMAGQPLVTMFSEDAALLDGPERMLRGTLRIGDAPPETRPLVRGIITGDDPR